MVGPPVGRFALVLLCWRADGVGGVKAGMGVGGCWGLDKSNKAAPFSALQREQYRMAKSLT